jgi:outer membrane lipoprotein SlyB
MPFLKRFCVPLAMIAGVLAGCSSPSTPVYESSQTGQMISEQRGEIVAVQDVVIKAPTAAAGSAGAGSRIGAGVAGAAITGNPISAVMAAGSVLGGIAGAGADNKKGEELTILLKDGRTVVIVQERGTVPFAIGEKVRIMSGSSGSIYGGPTSKVVRDDGYTNSY